MPDSSIAKTDHKRIICWMQVIASKPQEKELRCGPGVPFGGFRKGLVVILRHENNPKQGLTPSFLSILVIVILKT